MQLKVIKEKHILHIFKYIELFLRHMIICSVIGNTACMDLSVMKF